MKPVQKRILVVFSVIFTSLTSLSQDWYEMANSDKANYFKVEEVADKYFQQRGTGKGSGYKLYVRWKYFARRIMDENGNVPTKSEFINSKRKFDNQYFQKKAKAPFAGDWKELGPFSWRATRSWNPGVGRITAIAVEEKDQDLIFAGSPGGGIWRTINAGAEWVPLGDNLDDGDVFGIGIDPFNNQNVYHINSAGRILKSTNQGDSWSEIYNTGRGLSNTRSIVFHPTQQGTLLVASSNGIYKSTDDGASFQRVFSTSVEDVVYKPGDPSVVYACGTRFYKSTDGGNSFTQKSSGINSTERLRMAVTPANSDYVYLVQKSGSAFGALYRSTNSGESFSTRNATDPPYLTQASRDMAIMVSSTNAEEVHVAGMNNHRSTDGGNSFVQLAKWSEPATPAYIHADVEVMVCVNDVFYTGSDGGIFRSENHGNNYTDLSSLGGLAVHQFYRIAGSQQDHGMMIGGAQDNGCNIMKNRSKEWIGWTGADGMEVGVDQGNSNILYGSVQNGSFYKSTDGGNSYSSLNTPANGGGNWVTPFEVDPSNSNVLYVGYTDLHRSTDKGANWEGIATGLNLNMNLDEITIAPSNSDYIYIASGQDMWRTKNGTAANPTWTRVSGISGYVNYIAVDPDDPERVAIACSGNVVYVSTDAGTNWENKKMNLPNTGANCVIFDAETTNGLYVGTEKSVYYTNDLLTEWQPFGNGLPRVRVNELDINYAEKKLRVGTYGRGMWESGMMGSALIPSITAKGDFIFCDGEDVTLEAMTENLPVANYTYQWRKDGVDINGASGKQYVASEDGEYTVTVDDGDASGISGNFNVTVIESPTSPVSVVTSCGPGDVKLLATNDDVDVSWYASSNAGSPEFSGHEFITNVNVSTDYYIQAKTKVLKGMVGIPDNSTATGGSHGGGFYLKFDALSPLKLKKGKVYATGAKIRTLELRDVNNILIESKEINIPDGESVIDIDFNIPKGTGYQIGFANGADLFRSNAGVSYPYQIDGLISINSSTATSTPGDYYYYLYDWEVEEMYPVCLGERIKVEAKVLNKPSAPLTKDVVGCVNEQGPFTLEVDSNETGKFRWYDSNNSTTVIGTGPSLEVNSTDNFYVENVYTESISGMVGPSDHTFGDSKDHQGGFYLIFDAYKDIEIKKATVMALGAKDRTLELKDSTGAILVEKIINIPDGKSVIDIDITIPKGSGYQIGFGDGADLFRNSSGVDYPYTLDGVVSILNSTANSEYYYYLYNWEVAYDGVECAGDKAETAVRVDVCVGQNEVDNLLSEVKVFPNPSTGVINLNYNQDLNIESISIVDVTGRSVYTENQSVSSIDLGSLAPGKYFLRITNSDQISATYNIVISR